MRRAWHYFRVAGWVSVIGLCVLLTGYAVLTAWWLNRPVTLPTVVTPIPILNPDQRIQVGEPIRMLLTIDKPQEVDTQRTSRAIVCDSGNLVTLTESTVDVPVGTFTAVADNVDLPPKVTQGDTCRFRYTVDYRINPIRIDTVVWESEPFTVED